MSAGIVSERYAQALFELGQEEGVLSSLAIKLGEFAAMYRGSKELRSVLSHPAVPAAEKFGLVRALAQKIGVPEIGIKGLLVMTRRRRLSALHETALRLTELSDEQSGVVRASVTTATELPESFFDSLKSQVEIATQRKVVLSRFVDPELIGGAVARVRDFVLDASVRGRLEKVEKDLQAALSL